MKVTTQHPEKLPMSALPAPVDHGAIRTPKIDPHPRRPFPKIPRSLAGRTFNFDSLETMEEKEKIYGLWKMKALMNFTLGFEHYVSIGDTFEINGKNAYRLAEIGCAEFIDERMAQEETLLREARKVLGDNVDPRTLENFKMATEQPPAPRRNSWNS